MPLQRSSYRPGRGGRGWTPPRVPGGKGVRRFLILLQVAIVAAVAFLLIPAALREQDLATARTIGPEEMVFDWEKDSCRRDDIPDAPARAFRDYLGRVQLFASSNITRRNRGPELGEVKHSCAVVMASKRDANPAAFADNQWVTAPYTRDGRTIISLLHNEYQGHTHRGRCPSGQYLSCWYNSVTFALSDDGGSTFTPADAPGNLVAGVPYTYEPDQGPYGIFQPSNIVYRSTDRYYYVIVRAEQYKAQRRGSCVMRTRDLADPTSWRAWDGNGFDVQFIDPYRSPNSNPRDHVCRPVSPDKIRSMSESLTYNTYLKKFVLAGAMSLPDRDTRKPVWGVYFSTSTNLIDWSTPSLIKKGEFVFTWKCGDQDPIGYPSILDPESPSRNFETTGRRAYLYFVRLHYQFCAGTMDRDLLRVPIRFSK